MDEIETTLLLDESIKKMSQAVDYLKQELEMVRSGRLAPDMLGSVMVTYYEQQTPLRQLANFSSPDAQTLVVSPYEAAILPEVAKAINQAGLGLDALVDNGLVRVQVPMLTEERRKELVRHVHKLGEDAKISIRHARRDSNEHLKQLERDKQLSKDKLHDLEVENQQATDKWIDTAEKIIKQKEEVLLSG